MDFGFAIVGVVWFVGWPLFTLWLVNDVRKKERRRRRRMTREFADAMLAMRKIRFNGNDVVDDVCRRLIGG